MITEPHEQAGLRSEAPKETPAPQNIKSNVSAGQEESSVTKISAGLSTWKRALAVLKFH
jgi:hypothetical protein